MEYFFKQSPRSVFPAQLAAAFVLERLAYLRSFLNAFCMDQS